MGEVLTRFQRVTALTGALQKSMVASIFARLTSMLLLACVNLFGVVPENGSPRHDEIRA